MFTNNVYAPLSLELRNLTYGGGRKQGAKISPQSRELQSGVRQVLGAEG